MATLTTTQCLAAADNIAQYVADSLAALPSAGQITTASGDLATEVTRIQALTDTLVQPHLESAWTREQRTTAVGLLLPGRLLSWLNTLGYGTLLQNGPYQLCDALDFICSQVGSNTGLSNFLTNNTLLVDQYFADLFNQFVVATNSGAYVRTYTGGVPVAIPSVNVFPHANADYVNQWTATGATTGSLIAGTASLAAKSGGNTAPGGGTLEAYAGSVIGNSAYTITVTYTSMAGVAGQTVTFSVGANATLNTVFTPGVTVQAASIQSIAVTTGSATTSDVIRFRLKPYRSITA